MASNQHARQSLIAALRPLFFLLSVTACEIGVAHAQFDPTTVRRINNQLANDAISAVELFSAANTIATGSFAYDNPSPDDVRFSTYKLPLSHKFLDATNRFRPFLEGYLGYFDLRQNVSGLGPAPDQIHIQSVTATAGGGMEWRINNWLSATPRMLLAYSHAWQRFHPNASSGNQLGSLFPDWELDSLTLLPSMEINAAWTFGRWDIGANSHYTYIRVLGLRHSSDLIEVGSESHVWRNEIAASYRSPWKLFDMRLRPFCAFARHDLIGQIRHSGFVDRFYEARLGLGISMPEQLKLVSEVSLSGAYYFEGPFTGYTIGLSFKF